MKKMIIGIIALASPMLLGSCGIDDDPMTPPAEEPLDLLVTLTVQPPTSLRTVDTWTRWAVPVEVAFVLAEGGEGGHHGAYSPAHGSDGIAVLRKTQDGHEETIEGSIEILGMSMSMRLEGALSMWELEHGGHMVEHHAEQGEHHVTLELVETATGHGAHGGPTVSHCEVHLIATTQTGSEFVVELSPVQSGHGYRYESNAALPDDTYDLRVEVEPAHFLRDEHTMEHWVAPMEASFAGFTLDENFTGGTIGQSMWVGAAGDSLLVSLRAGEVKIYGAVGTGALPLSGDENINFSVRLEDPTREAHGEPLFDATVLVNITNRATGEAVFGILEPMYGEHGFHFGENLSIGLETGGPGEGGGHGHAK